MTSRYDSRNVFLNFDSKYDKVLDERKVNYVEQYTTPRFVYPTAEQMADLNVIRDVWRQGDRYWKLAYKYYNGRSDLWWVIAWFNKSPTEGNISVGDTVLIPTPLNKILEIYGY